MTKTKSSGKVATGKTIKQQISEAKKRLPSERAKKRCDGCFAPRKTLIVKTHLEGIFNKDEITVRDELDGVTVKCAFCKEFNYLSLGKFAMDVFIADYSNYKRFVLLKDDKWNSLIGFDQGEQLDLSDI